MTQTVVVENILSASQRGFVFNATGADGKRWRLVADRAAMPRAPVLGEIWSVEGRIRTHQQYGRQVVVSAATLARASGRLIVRLLQGPDFPDIGPKTAQLLWERCGERLYEILDAGDQEPLLEILGIGARGLRQAAVLLDGWKTVSIEPSVYQWLDRHGFPPGLARKLVDCYGAEVLARVEENPYRLMAFTDWAKVDDVARSMHVAVDDPRRLVAAVEAALFERLDLKHTWTAHETLRSRLASWIPAHLVAEAIDQAAEEGAVVRVGNGWMAAGPAAMEEFVSERCAAMMSGAADIGAQPSLLHAPMDQAAVESALVRLHAATGLALNAGQRRAVQMALEQPLALLLGGAGVGKTTVLAAIVTIAEEAGRTVHQIALSGRAALRMREATGFPARTIAGWLHRVERGEILLEDEPLVIVDEASMVDLPTLYRILRALQPGCNLLLVGDPAQLPPIGFGLTFHSLERGNTVPRVELSEVMRQAAETGIPQAALDIRNGVVPQLDRFNPTIDRGVSFIDAPRDRIADVVMDLVSTMGGLGSAQIVGSIKGRGQKTDGAILAINAEFHAAVATGRSVLFERFCPGEPVIWTVNDYDLGLFNGSLGTVVGRAELEDGPALAVLFDGETKLIPGFALNDLELAYAISCHKAQGSAFPIVIIPVVASRILDRTLLYTAVTRARRRVVLVGDRQAFIEAVQALPHSSLRETGFAFRHTIAVAEPRPSN